MPHLIIEYARELEPPRFVPCTKPCSTAVCLKKPTSKSVRKPMLIIWSAARQKITLFI